MDCRTFQKNLEDYLEGGLDFPGRFGMERHARQCFGCARVVADAQKLGQMARELTRVKAPADFETALLRRIQREGAVRRAWRFRPLPVFFLEWPARRLLFSGAAAMLVLGAAMFLAARWMREDRALVPAASVLDASAPLPQPAVVAEIAAPAMNPAAPEDMEPPANLLSLNPRRGLAAGAGKAPLRMEPADTDYVEYLVPGPGNRQYVMRLPKTIQMRYGQPSEEYFIRNVSH